MTEKIEELLAMLEDSGESAALAIADHLRTVASNGGECETEAYLLEEAKNFHEWAELVIRELKQ